MVLGDPDPWLTRFKRVDERFLERLEALWPCCMAMLTGQPDEDRITINLVDRLAKDPEVRRICHWVEYQFEPFGLASDGSRYSKGKIDMAVFTDRDRDQYLAYECKRLNVVGGDGSRSSLATRYVTLGMVRFLTQQYAEGLRLGGMIGYVMDGDMTAARHALVDAIPAQLPRPAISGPDVLPSIGMAERFVTVHDRLAADPIHIHHALLARR
jgi:hypothetical protein